MIPEDILVNYYKYLIISKILVNQMIPEDIAVDYYRYSIL